MAHIPVLTKEVLEYLNIRPSGEGSRAKPGISVGSRIIDATLDGGGHARAILEAQPEAKVLGIEWDPKLFEEVSAGLKDKANMILVNDSYTNLARIIQEHDFIPDGIIFDLGLSSWHYENSGRGFSFQKDEYLDMRFNPESGEPDASQFINTASREDLEMAIREYGEEGFSRQIADAIIQARRTKPITKTGELVEVISRAVPDWYKHKKLHFATKTFQALRIAVNHELENVEKGVGAAIEALKPGGRLVVISFQGLEDKVVKNIFREKNKEGIVKFVVKGTVKPSWAETKTNPRARSAKMKVVEKT